MDATRMWARTTQRAQRQQWALCALRMDGIVGSRSSTTVRVACYSGLLKSTATCPFWGSDEYMPMSKASASHRHENDEYCM